MRYGPRFVRSKAPVHLAPEGAHRDRLQGEDAVDSLNGHAQRREGEIVRANLPADDPRVEGNPRQAPYARASRDPDAARHDVEPRRRVALPRLPVLIVKGSIGDRHAASV